MPKKKPLNFRLDLVADEVIRDNFLQLQEYVEDQSESSLYEGGYSIYTETFDVPLGSVKRTVPGQIFFLSGRVKTTTGGWANINNDGAVGNYPDVWFYEGDSGREDQFVVTNNNIQQVTAKIFCLYKRP